MAPTLKPRRARALLEQAELHRQRGEWEQATTLARQVAEESTLVEPAAFSILAEGYEQLGRVEDAEAALRNGLLRKPSPELQAALGSLLTRGGKIAEGLALLEKVKARLGRNPGYLSQFGLALMQAGREDDAEAVLTNALTLGGGNDARLVMAALKGKRGDYQAADALAATVEAAEPEGALLRGARAIRADCRLFLGDAAGALGLWKALRAYGELDPGQLGLLAYAAQLAG
ncbi:MAG: sulfotransferase, partial [Myxococcaceae bacterium]|nr:sulfotransferase [Myxococcaceae bacterium]